MAMKRKQEEDADLPKPSLEVKYTQHRLPHLHLQRLKHKRPQEYHEHGYAEESKLTWPQGMLLFSRQTKGNESWTDELTWDKGYAFHFGNGVECLLEPISIARNQSLS